MDRRVRLTGIVKGRTINIEVNLNTFEKITRYAIRMNNKRFYCAGEIFSNLDKQGRPVNEESVN